MKAIRSYILAALVLTAAAAVACTVEDQPSQIKNKVTFVASLSPRGAGSRALSDPGDGTLASSWTVGEELSLQYDNTSSQRVEAVATVTSVESDGSATITATLADPVSCTASFCYPYSSCTLNKPKSIFTDQTGTLEDVSANYELVSGTGAIVVNGTEATLPQSVEMTHETCVWKMSFTDGSSDITPTITSLTVSDGNNDYTVSPSGLSTIFVSMYPTASSANVSIAATTASGTYSLSRSGVTLEAGKLYTSTGVALSASSGDPLEKALALKENTYSVQKTGETAQVFPLDPAYSQWYVGPSYMDGTQEAIHVEMMDEDPELMTMGWFSGEFPPEVANQPTTVDEDFCMKYKWSSAKMGTMRLSGSNMLDAHMGQGGNVKLDGRSKFWIKVKTGTKSYSGDYQFLFVFVFVNQTWDPDTESYIYGDEYTICGNATLKELIADLDNFSLDYPSSWVAPGKSITLTASWTAGAKFDWSKVTLNSQTRNGASGEWFSWDASTQKLTATQSAENEQVKLTFGYAGTDMTDYITLYNGPGYSSFSLSMQNSSADFILVENDPAYGWGSDSIWLTVDSWTPEGSSFTGYGIEIDPATENYNKLYYNPYGKYVDFKKGIPEGEFNLIFRSVTDHNVKFTIPVKVVHHKPTSFQITYKHSNGAFEPWTSGGENGVCNYPMGMEVGVITTPEDAYWNWAYVELAYDYDGFSFSGMGGKEDHPKIQRTTSNPGGGTSYGTQIIFRLKYDNRKKSEIYVNHN